MPFDLLQVILVLTIVVLTALLTVIGIEVFYILKDVRRLIDRVHNLVGDAEHIVDNVKKPTQMIASIGQSAELLTKLFDIVKRHEETQVITESKEEKPSYKSDLYKPEMIIEQRPSQIPTDRPQTLEHPIMTQKTPALGRRFFRMPRRPAS